MLTNLKESLIVASNRFLQKCPVTHILVRIARSAHSFFSLFRSRQFNSSCAWHKIPHACVHMKTYFSQCVARLLACLAAFLSHVSLNLSFFVSRPVTVFYWQTLGVHCTLRVFLRCDTPHHFNESYSRVFFLSPRIPCTERRKSTHSYLCKIKIITIIITRVVTRKRLQFQKSR